MSVRAFVLTIGLSAGAGALALAQPAPAPPPPAQPPRVTPAPRPAPEQTLPTPSTAVAPRREFAGQPVNIRVEVTITDQRGAGAAPKKTVTVVTGDQLSGFIRTQTLFPGIGDVPLNVDAEPQILSDGKIRLRLNLQYDLPAPVGTTEGDRTPLKTTIRENLALVLENGKPLVAAQSADPVSDRQVTVEVKATILR
jgi:hypothetical protein